MAQFARPISDITTEWTTTPLWSKIDEVTPLDADWITGTGAGVTAEVKLSAVNDPLTDANHDWSLRFQATGGGGKEKITLSLYEGTTLIELLMDAVNITRDVFTLHNGTLVNAANITDYTDLRFRILTVGSGGSETIDCSWAELSVPDAASTPVEESVSLAKFKGVAQAVYAGIPVSFSLGRDAGQSAAELGNVQETVAQDRISTVTSSTLINSNEAVSLNRVNVAAASEFSIFDEAFSLALSKALSVLEDYTSTIQESVSLSLLLGTTSYSQELSNEIVSLAKEKGMASVSQLAAYSEVSLSRINYISTDTLSVIFDVLSLGRDDGLSAFEDLLIPINESISLARLLGAMSYSQVIGEEAVSLNRISAIPAASLGTVYDLINLGHIGALTVLEETQGQIEESVILARLLGITSYSQIISNEATSLSSFYGLGAASQRISDASVIFSSFYGLSVAELFEASELVILAKTNSVSLADNIILFDNVGLLKVVAILAEPQSLYIFANGNNAFGIVYRDKRFRVVFRDKRA